MAHEDYGYTDSELAARKKVKAAKRKENRAKLDAEKEEKGLVARKPASTVAGQKQRMQELKAKLLSDGNSANILRKILDVAYNDEHPGQMQALKMCFDRMLPTSMFEEKKGNTDRPVISINISGINEPQKAERIIDNDLDDSEH